MEFDSEEDWRFWREEQTAEQFGFACGLVAGIILLIAVVIW